jgi:hypothetical protein
MQVLNVPTPAYLADEEFSIFRNSVGRFLDDNAPPEKFESWRRAKVVERDLWTKAGARRGCWGCPRPRPMAASAAISATRPF